MRQRWIVLASLLVALASIAEPSPPRSAIESAIEATASPDRRVRSKAIRNLRYHASPEVVEALSRILFAEPADPEAREEDWYVAAWTLVRVATVEPLPEPLLARLRVLAAMEPTITVVVVMDRVGRPYPKFGFDRQAQEALDTAAFATERRALAKELAARREAGVEWLAEVAWAEPPEGGATRRKAAQFVLGEQGTRGLAPTLGDVAGASEESQLDMVRYAEAVCAEHLDAGCLPLVSALLDSPHEEVPPQAWLALGNLAPPGATELAVAKLQQRGVGNDRSFTEAGLSAIGRLKDPRAIPFLSSLLAHDSLRVSFAAGWELTQFGDAGREVLVASSRSSDPRRRRAAILGLSRLETAGDCRATAAIEEALRAHPEDLESDALRGFRQKRATAPAPRSACPPESEG